MRARHNEGPRELRKAVTAGANSVGSSVCAMAVLFMCLLLTGCGRKQQLEDLTVYTEEMTTFCNTIAGYQEQLDAIDPQDSAAEETFLGLIDEMATVCTEASNASVPEGYEEAGEMCRQAADYMQEAKGEYHTALEADTLDQETLAKANQSYRSAGQCIRLMLDGFDAGAGTAGSMDSSAETVDITETIPEESE